MCNQAFLVHEDTGDFGEVPLGSELVYSPDDFGLIKLPDNSLRWTSTFLHGALMGTADADPFLFVKLKNGDKISLLDYASHKRAAPYGHADSDSGCRFSCECYLYRNHTNPGACVWWCVPYVFHHMYGKDYTNRVIANKKISFEHLCDKVGLDPGHWKASSHAYMHGSATTALRTTSRFREILGRML